MLENLFKMITINYTEFRKSLKKNLDLACNSHETILIQRPKDKNVILLSLKDYNSMVETYHLLSTKANANRLITSINQVDDEKAKHVQ